MFPFFVNLGTCMMRCLCECVCVCVHSLPQFYMYCVSWGQEAAVFSHIVTRLSDITGSQKTSTHQQHWWLVSPLFYHNWQLPSITALLPSLTNVIILCSEYGLCLGLNQFTLRAEWQGVIIWTWTSKLLSIAGIYIRRIPSWSCSQTHTHGRMCTHTWWESMLTTHGFHSCHPHGQTLIKVTMLLNW